MDRLPGGAAVDLLVRSIRPRYRRVRAAPRRRARRHGAAGLQRPRLPRRAPGSCRHEERAARQRVGRSLRQRIGADDADQGGAARRRRRRRPATRDQDRARARLPLRRRRCATTGPRRDRRAVTRRGARRLVEPSLALGVADDRARARARGARRVVPRPRGRWRVPHRRRRRRQDPARGEGPRARRSGRHAERPGERTPRGSIDPVRGAVAPAARRRRLPDRPGRPRPGRCLPPRRGGAARAGRRPSVCSCSSTTATSWTSCPVPSSPRSCSRAACSPSSRCGRPAVRHRSTTS